ncbi:MAG TPA: carboxypeptidase-like regulatory domain-containing protein, partial [Ignavibacteriales bacterium]|nr:carboxypeptidase-like regulatory domain-containing protein [Ignavibacteriales bacterium]
MKSLLPAAIVLICASNIYAQGGKISGKVTDAGTGEDLIGVNVVLEGTTMGAATDISGEYYILNIPPGNYTLAASLVGYKKTVIQNVEVSSNHTTQIDLKLAETVMSIDQDIVIMAQRDLVEKDQTSTRHFVDAEEISTRPATQLTEILTTLPGIDQSATGELTV